MHCVCVCSQGDIPSLVQPNSIISPPTNSLGSIDWTVKPAEKAKYDQLFDSLQPVNGMLPGNKVIKWFFKVFIISSFDLM